MSTIDLNEFKNNRSAIHFIGCAGVGTLPLMEICLAKGYRVFGSDLLESPAFMRLRKAGAVIHTGEHKPENVPTDMDCVLVVHSSAVSEDNPEMVYAKQHNYPCVNRGTMLAMLAKSYKRVVTISGSHGKTSVTAMLAYLLKKLQYTPGFLIGGFINSWNGVNGSAGEGDDIFVTEVDESDGTHTMIESAVALITNIEDDHSWSVGGVQVLEDNFRKYTNQAEKLFYIQSPNTERILGEHPNHVAVTPSSDLTKFFPCEILQSWPDYQLSNAVLALCAADELGIPMDKAANALIDYPGVERRMTLHYQDENYTLIEDYAHHPTEVRCAITALRKIHHPRRLIIIFQPHRYARLERYFSDFVEILNGADCVYIPPVFAAWNASGKYKSEDLAREIGSKAKNIPSDWEKAAQQVLADSKQGDLIAVVGAGDVHKIIEPIKQELQERHIGKTYYKNI